MEGPGRAAAEGLGLPVLLPAEMRRVVSLVPSLTEAVAVTARGLVAGVTNWCTHPAGLQAERVGGTKNPDVARIVALSPDLVLANEEENREADLSALRAVGIPVWVTRVRSLPAALAPLHRMLTLACRLSRPACLHAGPPARQHMPA